ncbi:MAG: anti-sigma factor [Ferruginibacter sp.]
MNKEEIISSGLLELYALGVASAEEVMVVESYINKYPDLKEELYSIEETMEQYALGNSVEPSSGLKDNIFNSINDFSETKINVMPISPARIFQIPPFFKMMAAVVIALLVVSVILTWNYYNKFQNTQNELNLAYEKIDKQEKNNQAMASDMDVITNKYSQPVVLKGTPKSPESIAKIFWMKNSGDVFIDASNLPQTPDNKQYKLWAIVDGKPVDAGMIETKKGKYYIQKMKSFGQAQAFAITLEKSGGSTSPTMEEMVVISSM